MDLFDLWWDSAQEAKINELKAQAQAHSLNSTASIRRLQEENRELRIRVGVLIRLLIERGVFSADDYARTVQETKAQLDSPPASRKTSARKK
jgi:hypothetical protein